MKFMTSHIEIGNYVFKDRLNECVINSSWKSLSDTATIKLPNIKRVLERDIKVGDPVLIRLGYNDNLSDEFSGYVSAITPGTPVKIECMDEMWKLKQETVTKSWSKTTLEAVLKYLVPDATIAAPDVTLEPFRLSEVSKFDALKKLKEEYALVIYFRNGVLWAGLAYQEDDPGEVRYHFQQNALMGDLTFRNSADVKVKVKAVNILSNNTQQTVEVGDADGDTRTLHFYNLGSLAELKKQATEKINLMKFDGYRGSLTGFGLPIARHGMTAVIMDDKYPEREGTYFIDSVKTTYGPAGFRRVVELGRKSNADLIAA